MNPVIDGLDAIIIWGSAVIALACVTTGPFFALRYAGQAIRRRFPRVGKFLGIPQVHNTQAAYFGTPAE